MPDAACPAQLVIDRATQDDWATVVAWAADEGWNPGLGDASAFFAQDPDGFFLGRVDGEPATAVSVVNAGPEYAFLGFYLVRPDLRGRGLGLSTWRAGLEHAGDRVVGLDGVVALAQEAGLQPSFDTARMYTGPVRNHYQEKVFGVTTLELG